MSVENRRLAAAQRTAAKKTSGAQAPRRRWLRLASWLVIVPTLSLFSFSVVAVASGFGSKPASAGDARFWERFTIGYLVLLVVYTWYLFTLLFVHDVRPRRYPAYADEKIAVLIPCFNESAELVEESIRTVLAAEGRKQVIVIDDGSTNGVQEHLAHLAEELPIAVHYFAENRGKREALHVAVT